MFRHMVWRENGMKDPRILRTRARLGYELCLEPSCKKEIRCPNNGAVNCMQVDSSEDRYLLSGSSDSTISIFDLFDPPGAQLPMQVRPVASVNGTEDGNSKETTCVAWYTRDTGLFLTGSEDKTVKIWDTNALVPVFHLRLSGLIRDISLSKCSTNHSLVAIASEELIIRLCDLRTAAFSHTITGAGGNVLSVKWFPANEYLIAAGSDVGTVQVWDVRQNNRSLWSCNSLDSIGVTPFSSRIGSTVLKNKTTEEEEKASLRKAVSEQTLYIERQRSAPFTSRIPVSKAHTGSVPGILFSNSGQHMVSAGTDRICLWSAHTCKHLFVHFDGASRNTRGGHMACSDSDLLYVPKKAKILRFVITTGQTLPPLSAHFDDVMCCAFNTGQDELYSAGRDGHIVCWSLPPRGTDEEEEDEWSDSS